MTQAFRHYPIWSGIVVFSMGGQFGNRMKVRKLLKVVLLVTGIIAASGFYFRKTEEWTRGFQPFLVHGQGNPTGPTETFLDPIIPLIMVGSFDGGATQYSTVIQITSTSNAGLSASLSGDFFSSDGSPFPATFRSNRTGNFRGALPQISLPVRQTMVITADQDNAGLIGWGRIVVSTNPRLGEGNIFMSTIIQTRDTRTGESIYRFPVDSTSTGMSSFLLQRVSNAAGADVGFVIVNNSDSAPANVTATLQDVNGSSLISRTLRLGPLGQIAYFVPTLFSLDAESGGPNYTSILFESDSSQLAASALASGAGPFFTVPIGRLR